jgi:hypothetical protein
MSTKALWDFRSVAGRQKRMSIAPSHSLDAVSHCFVQLGRQIVSHAVNQHEFGTRNGRGRILATRRDEQRTVATS